MKRLIKLYKVCHATTNNVKLWVKWSTTSSAISNSNVRKHTICNLMKKYILLWFNWSNINENLYCFFLHIKRSNVQRLGSSNTKLFSMTEAISMNWSLLSWEIWNFSYHIDWKIMLSVLNVSIRNCTSAEFQKHFIHDLMI